FTGRRPNRIASRDVGIQMSIRLPRTIAPVSATRYSPLYAPASSRTREPKGKCLGSAAIKPFATMRPLAVRPRRLYAVATYVVGGTSYASSTAIFSPTLPLGEETSAISFWVWEDRVSAERVLAEKIKEPVRSAIAISALPLKIE